MLYVRVLKAMGGLGRLAEWSVGKVKGAGGLGESLVGISEQEGAPCQAANVSDSHFSLMRRTLSAVI